MSNSETTVVADIERASAREPVVNDFSIQVATINGSGSQSANSVLMRSIFQMGVPVSGKNLFPSNIAGLPTWFTIRANPLFGVGFGQKFLQPLTLPDISFFEFWEYLPHNAMLWVWIKTGIFGFVAMLFLFARAVQHGARSAMQVRSYDHVAVVVMGFSYVVMFLVFSYVDIAWDARSTIFLAVSFALCADFVHAEVPSRPLGPRHFEMVPQ